MKGGPDISAWQEMELPDGEDGVGHLGHLLLRDRGAAENCLDLLNLALCIPDPGGQAGVLQAVPWPQGGRGIPEAAEAQGLLLEVGVVGLEAVVAGHAHGVAVAVASLALVTAGPGQAGAAEAAARGLVTAGALGSPEVTVTGWGGEK